MIRRAWAPRSEPGRDLEDLLGARDPAAVGVLAVAPRGPRVGRGRRRLGQLEPAVLGQPRPLALDAAARVGRSGQHLAEHVEQAAELRRQRLAGRA